MPKAVIFGPFQFRTKRAATEEIRRRINRYEAGDKLDSDDELFFYELFKLHDEHQEKVGLGINHIQVERDFHKNRCLYIHRIDGTKIDISWVHCVRPATVKSTVSMAFRRAIKDRVIKFKNQCLQRGHHCPVLAIPLTYENSHVAYTYQSFDSLLSEFLSKAEYTYESVALENPESEDRDQRAILKNGDLRDSWVDYHGKNAKLELLSSEANLRRQVNGTNIGD